MRRKAEFASQIFMFVLGLVIVAGVLFFGYRVIENMQAERCEVQGVQFGSQLQTYFDRNKGLGTNRVVSLNLPCQTEHVCFVSREVVDDAKADPSAITSLTITDAPSNSVTNLMLASIQSGGDATNVWAIEADGTMIPVERFSTASAAISVRGTNGICIQGSAGKIELRLQGTGAVVEVSGVQEP